MCFVPSKALHPQAWFIMVHPLCCAPLGSELLFLSSTCGGMLPALPSCLLGQVPLNKERVCLRSLSDRKLRRSLKEVMGSNGNLLKRLSWPVGCCLDLLQSVNTLAAVLWSPARARHWMLLCVRERERERECKRTERKWIRHRKRCRRRFEQRNTKSEGREIALLSHIESSRYWLFP